MKFSVHRYISRCITEGIPLSKKDRILPCCVCAISYCVTHGIKYFLVARKREGHIDGGKIETLPQGFCDAPDLFHLSQFVSSTFTRELREETNSSLDYHSLTYLGLATDDTPYNHEYALLAALEITDTELFFSLSGVSTYEHEELVIVPEKDLDRFFRTGSHASSLDNSQAAAMSLLLFELFSQRFM